MSVGPKPCRKGLWVGFPLFFLGPLTARTVSLYFTMSSRTRRFSGNRRRRLGLLFDNSAGRSQSEGVSAVCRHILVGSRPATPSTGHAGCCREFFESVHGDLK